MPVPGTGSLSLATARLPQLGAAPTELAPPRAAGGSQAPGLGLELPGWKMPPPSWPIWEEPHPPVQGWVTPWVTPLPPPPTLPPSAKVCLADKQLWIFTLQPGGAACPGDSVLPRKQKQTSPGRAGLLAAVSSGSKEEDSVSHILGPLPRPRWACVWGCWSHSVVMRLRENLGFSYCGIAPVA